MNELLPIVSGLVLGSALALIQPRRPGVLGLAASIVLGALATVLSGEYAIAWTFLLIDVALVGACAAGAFAFTAPARARLAAARGRQEE